ncbi:MAG: hypothetical protein SFW36_22425 [Leptolyngbyaceae cyanobacterium bins.59]|nr:hypothetical protein [Leptolyngbyaceae cyanobacterium bins.59]
MGSFIAEFYLDELSRVVRSVAEAVSGNGSIPTTSLQIAMRFRGDRLFGKQSRGPVS